MRSFLLVLAVACAPPPVEPPPPPGAIDGGTPAFTVDGRPVTREMIGVVMERVPPEMATRVKTDPAAFEEIQERLTIGELLYFDAIQRKLYEKPEVAVAIALATREVLGTEVLQAVADESVTDAAVQKWYDDHQVQYRRPSARIGHLLLADGKVAEEVAALAKGGADFAELARKYGDPQAASTGGEIGWVEKGRLMPALDGPAFAGAAGEVVGPLLSEAGFHVMKIHERRELTPLESVREQIESQIQQEAMDAYVKKLREPAVVVKVADPFAPEAPAAPATPAAPAAPAPAPAVGG